MQYFLYLLAIPFLFINYKIIVSDLKYKKIPNKYLVKLLLLIPFYYIYIFFIFPNINILLFLGQILTTLLISFILYYYGIWAAGDAKYLLVLALFIPYIGIIPFIGNIALLTIIYLIGYFIYFYFGKLMFSKNYRFNIYSNIKKDLNEKWIIYKGNKGGKTYIIILKGLITFLLIFITIRLSRIYLFNSMLESNKGTVINNLIEKYNFYLIIILILLSILILYLIKKIILKFKNFISIKTSINLNLFLKFLLYILFISLIGFIIYEYKYNPYNIKQYLFKIITIYILIYIVIKILMYSYKITFGIAEIELINIKDLKVGDIIDKTYLVKIFGTQSALGFSIYEKDMSKRKNYLLYPNPIEYFSNIENPINKKNLNIIKQAYRITNIYHKKNKNDNYNHNKTIKILKTFSFAPYILTGFIITFMYKNIIIEYLLKGIENIIINKTGI